MLIAERISARHLILQHDLGQCIYICPSRSSAHARAGRDTCSSCVRWMAEVSFTLNASVFRAMDEEREDQCERAQHLRHCMPVSTPDQTPGPSPFCCVSIFYAPSILSFLFTVRGICLRTLCISSYTIASLYTAISSHFDNKIGHGYVQG